jgi:hypothetical protein
MKLRLTLVLSAAGFFLSIAGAQAVTVSASDRLSVVRSDVVKIASCVGGRRCKGYYTNSRGVRVCRAWVACN